MAAVETDTEAAHCDCVFEGETDATEPRCSARLTTDDRSRWLCTRPTGHDGPHSACTPETHPAVSWEGEG